MQRISRSEADICYIVLTSSLQIIDTGALVIEYRKNTLQEWTEATLISGTLDCCGWVVALSIDASLMTDGSYFLRIYKGATQVATEEIVLYTETTESVSNVEGVKIIA